jgi:hypothetical protein
MVDTAAPRFSAHFKRPTKTTPQPTTATTKRCALHLLK